MRYLTVASGLSLALSLASPPVRANEAPPALTPVKDRLTDEAIRADLKVFETLEGRLQVLREAQPSPSLYLRAKAQGWLAFARDEYSKNDRSDAAEAALEQAHRLIARLESGDSSLVWDTPLVAGASKLGGELWALTDTIRFDAGFRCIEAEVAKLEIELVRAGHEDGEGNPCHAEEHLKAAQALADDVWIRVKECRPQPKRVVSAPPPPPPPPSPAEIKRQIELLPKFVHFALDSSSISRASADVLDTVARILVAIPQIKVQMEGHTDKRASAAYNLGLSKRRADAVRKYLVEAGVTPERLQVFYYGKSRPRVPGESFQVFARNRCVIFTYIQPADVEIEVVPQEGDLQLETGGNAKP